MDCCSKYPGDYTRTPHHPMPPVGGINSSGIMTNVSGGGGGGGGIGSYGHHSVVHPSLRYQQSLYRFSGGHSSNHPSLGYNGIGPTIGNNSGVITPSPQHLLQPHHHHQIPPHPSLYQNYDMRYGSGSSYTNLSSNAGSTPLYPYSNSNGFSYGHLNNRDVSRYYNHHQLPPPPLPSHCDSYGRIIASPRHGYSYQHHYPHHQSYRDMYDPIVGMHHAVRNGGSTLNGTNSSYHLYGHQHHSTPSSSPHPSITRPYDYHPSQYYSPHHLHHMQQQEQQQQLQQQHHHYAHLNNSSNSNHYPENVINQNDQHLRPDYAEQNERVEQIENNDDHKDSNLMLDVNDERVRTPENLETNNKSLTNSGRNSRTDVIDVTSNSERDENNKDDTMNTLTSNRNIDSNAFNTDLTAPSSPLTNGSAISCTDSGISGCGNANEELSSIHSNKTSKGNDDNEIVDLENNDINEIDKNNDDHQQQEDDQQISPRSSGEHVAENQSSKEDLSSELKESKPKTSSDETDLEQSTKNKLQSSMKQKTDCPLVNMSPVLERSNTPYPSQQHHHHHHQNHHNHHHHNNNQQQQPQQQYQNYNNQQHHHHYHNPNQSSRYLNTNNNNFLSRFQNGYYHPSLSSSSNQSNGSWSPYSSPHYNWSYPCSPLSLTTTPSTTAPTTATKTPATTTTTTSTRTKLPPSANTKQSSAATTSKKLPSTTQKLSSVNRKRSYTNHRNAANRQQQLQQHQQKQKQQQRLKQSQQQKSIKTPLIVINKNRVLECDFIPSKKSKRKIKSEPTDDSFEFREEIKDIKPLPGFQQAFGSTEIGRFSEIFLFTPESPNNNLPYCYESEADTMSPYPWETGDSLEGPHFNLQHHFNGSGNGSGSGDGGSMKSIYSNSSLIDSQYENNININNNINNNNNNNINNNNSNYFKEIRCNDY